MDDKLYQIIAHRSSASQFGGASLPVKMADGYLPPLTEYFARMIVDALNSKSTPNVHYSMEQTDA